MRHVLGLDPGKEGGAVLLSEEHRIVCAWSWSPVQRQKRKVLRLQELVTGRQEIHRSLLGVGSAIAQGAKEYEPRVVVEDTYIPRAKRKMSAMQRNRHHGGVMSAVRLAMNTGELVAAIRHHLGPPTFCMAGVWRQLLFGLSPFTGRVEAKTTTCRLMPQRIPDLKKLKGVPGHVVDATGLAEWGLITMEDT
jgi:hypothetical protein